MNEFRNVSVMMGAVTETDSLRETVRLNADRLQPGWDIILVARSRALDAPFRKLQTAYLGSCEKLGLLRQEDRL